MRLDLYCHFSITLNYFGQYLKTHCYSVIPCPMHTQLAHYTSPLTLCVDTHCHATIAISMALLGPDTSMCCPAFMQGWLTQQPENILQLDIALTHIFASSAILQHNVAVTMDNTNYQQVCPTDR